jgi:hypothetical protein
MQAFWNHPAMVAIRDEFWQLVWTLERLIRAVEPMTWALIAVAAGAVWMFFIRRPAR